MSVSFKPIRPLLQTGNNAASRWFSYFGLGIGVVLLLCSIQMYINIQQMLAGNAVRKNGYDYISITKTVTNATMGQTDKNLFQPKDLEELKAQPFIENAAPLVANQFRVQLSAGDILPFKTDLFLETLENDFIDTLPPNFQWQEGQENIPIIVSSDFLEIYNVFAPGQGLPQISEATATGVPVFITCISDSKRMTFQGNIVAFSDRINSVLAPKSFLTWANQQFGSNQVNDAARVFIKTKDANNAQLLNFLDQKNYKVNKDKTKFGRVKQVIQGIFSGLGVFGLLVIVLALLLFSFYLQLVIARSKSSLALLLTLGYSPTWLSKNVARQFMPIYFFIILGALLAVQTIQWAFHEYVMIGQEETTTLVHWGVALTAVVLLLLSVYTNYRLIRKLLFKLS
ncbi:hypothetical protein [Flavisolibacter tropicus]|uniref:Uncharacterized protein n=1 Tax=Flavisolibacter tropicus TaxID=1492898 RepID=A0A172TV58_9BACT|nr:hypothetical protein [Flavisolibacter tropicus]ANE50965.1 hypothetical protein SY85_11080 [Flavisolibacter tropicus]